MKKYVALIASVYFLFLGMLILNGQSEESKIYLPLVQNNYDPSWKWQESITITLSPSPWGIPLTIIDHQGRFHILWSTLTVPRYIYHTYYDGNQWSPQLPMAETLGYSKVLYAPLVDGNGHLHLVWHNDLGLGESKRLMYAEFDGTSWGSEQEIYRTDNSSVQGMPQLDGHGRVQITLLDGSYSTTAYQAIENNNAWQLSGAIQPGHLVQWTWPDMSGGIHFYGSDYNNHLFYSYWNSSGFQIQNYQTTGTITGRQTQLDGQNNLHTFWTSTVSIPGSSVTGLYYQCLDHNLSWQPQSVLSGRNAVNGTPQKASDTSSQVALAWEEKQRDWFVVGVWHGCKQTDVKDIPDTYPTTQTLQALAISQTPGKLCVLTKKDYSSEFAAVCADIDE